MVTYPNCKTQPPQTRDHERALRHSRFAGPQSSAANTTFPGPPDPPFVVPCWGLLWIWAKIYGTEHPKGTTNGGQVNRQRSSTTKSVQSWSNLNVEDLPLMESKVPRSISPPCPNKVQIGLIWALFWDGGGIEGHPPSPRCLCRLCRHPCSPCHPCRFHLQCCSGHGHESS